MGSIASVCGIAWVKLSGSSRAILKGREASRRITAYCSQIGFFGKGPLTIPLRPTGEAERMAWMDHDSYWYQYFAARRDVELYIGLFSIGFSLISTITGKTLVKYQGIVSRTEDPKEFWQTVILVYAMGAIFLGLFLFGPS
jgi:hypothetical protein